MGIIQTPSGTYRRVEYKTEADLEASVMQVREELFGRGRVYLDVKRKIGAKGGVRNIPDGYLLDLAGPKPRLYVVENELQAHDPLRHIAVQILQFSLSFESEPITVKRILQESIAQDRTAMDACESYVGRNKYRNLDHLLEELVFNTPFAALVIIDEMPDSLQNILSEKFRFGVEVLELARFERQPGIYAYGFEPFLADVLEDLAATTAAKALTSDGPESGELDTVVVPARNEGFERVFLGENRWYAVRIHGAMRPQIRYIAGYQVAPVSAITHLAPVQSIEPYKDSDKVVVNFAEPARQIGPIPLVKNGLVRPLQGLRYTNRARLEKARTLDELWGPQTEA